MSGITGRPVVVTGGGNGIGRALAHEAASRGASAVHVVDLDVDAAQVVAAEIESSGTPATAHGCDVADAAAVEALATTIVGDSGVPALVCANAGVMAGTAPLLDTDAANAAWILSVNTLGTMHTLQSFGRRMVAGDTPGWLMATGSEHSVGVPHPMAGAYTASKHAVLGMCDVMRGELPEHVGVSVLCPGLTTSQLWNATTQRPDAFGGAEDGDPMAGAFMEHAGMDAATVATRAFDGVEAGNFLIPTHYNARTYAERRSGDMTEAFDRLGAIDTTDYDVNRLAGDLLAAQTEEGQG